jgi:WD40 repeat protein
MTITLDRGPTLDLKSHCIGSSFIGDVALFATSAGEIVVATRAAGEEGRETVHGDGIIAALAASDGKTLVTLGENGRVRRVSLDVAEDIAPGDGKWPSALATGPDGAVAVGAGKRVTVYQARKPERVLDAGTLVSGLAFAPKGFRLALARYEGVTLWYPNLPEAAPEDLKWKGSHIDIAFSPNGAFLITSMQELALHGWRMSDKAHMRMTGYPGKTRSMHFDHRGEWLATSGAEAAVLWPFKSNDGPMGKAPKEVAFQRNTTVSCVAFHKAADVLAVGYANGRVALVRMSDEAELEAIAPTGSAIATLAWSPTGRLLAWSTEEGRAGLFPTSQGAG